MPFGQQILHFSILAITESLLIINFGSKKKICFIRPWRRRVARTKVCVSLCGSVAKFLRTICNYVSIFLSMKAVVIENSSSKKVTNSRIPVESIIPSSKNEVSSFKPSSLPNRKFSIINVLSLSFVSFNFSPFLIFD